MHEWVREMAPEPKPWHDLCRTAEMLWSIYWLSRPSTHRFRRRRRRRRCIHIGKPTFKLMNIKWKLTFLEKIGWNEIAFKLDDDETYTELNRFVRVPVDACLCLRESWAGHISYGYAHQWLWAYTRGLGFASKMCGRCCFQDGFDWHKIWTQLIRSPHFIDRREIGRQSFIILFLHRLRKEAIIYVRLFDWQ